MHPQRVNAVVLRNMRFKLRFKTAFHEVYEFLSRSHARVVIGEDIGALADIEIARQKAERERRARRSLDVVFPPARSLKDQAELLINLDGGGDFFIFQKLRVEIREELDGGRIFLDVRPNPLLSAFFDIFGLDEISLVERRRFMEIGDDARLRQFSVGDPFQAFSGEAVRES